MTDDSEQRARRSPLLMADGSPVPGTFGIEKLGRFLLITEEKTIPARMCRITWGDRECAVPALCMTRIDRCEPHFAADFPYSGGAAYTVWKKAKPAALFALIFCAFIDLTKNYGLPGKLVDAGFDVMPEYRKPIQANWNKMFAF